jgi:hypothetical protein
MITINVNVTDGASPALAAFISAMTGPQMTSLNERGGRAAQQAAATYHREFDQAGGWKGKRHLDALTGGSSWGADVARGWELQSFDQNGAVIANDADHYAFKVSGGTILPKRWEFLTIPMIPEARGLLARGYVRETGRKLFRPRRKDGTKSMVLAERVPGQKGFRTVYALVKSVTMGPWPGSVPPDDVIAGAFFERWRDGITEIIDAE